MKQRWQDWVMLVLGAWVFLSPFWMPAYSSMSNAAAWNSYIFGGLAFVLAWAALATGQIWEEWLNLLIGIWLIIAPFVLHFHNAEAGAGWNQIILGILMGADAIWVISAARARGQLPASPAR